MRGVEPDGAQQRNATIRAPRKASQTFVFRVDFTRRTWLLSNAPKAPHTYVPIDKRHVSGSRIVVDLFWHCLARDCVLSRRLAVPKGKAAAFKLVDLGWSGPSVHRERQHDAPIHFSGAIDVLDSRARVIYAIKDRQRTNKVSVGIITSRLRAHGKYRTIHAKYADKKLGSTPQ